jgi:hypothetical protein
VSKPEIKRRHDHRQSLWIIAGGHVLWCYQCGAWKMNRYRESKREPWNKPTGIGGPNPALAQLELFK